MEVADYLDALKKYLPNSGVDSKLHEIQSFFNDHDFEEAFDMLHEMARNLGITALYSWVDTRIRSVKAWI
ncbi:hypothetical protein U27_00513 [Candidatus Vecturithrix granuli]|uniref:Uncharacterized protein n=1 Tax=Vecturithrix granuli TaxID=1499967 RepID=A0A081C7R1_VECG1|nr:hypothetical protein U27_00513 [Candidatus Vecturithrix granuli]